MSIGCVSGAEDKKMTSKCTSCGDKTINEDKVCTPCKIIPCENKKILKRESKMYLNYDKICFLPSTQPDKCIMCYSDGHRTKCPNPDKQAVAGFMEKLYNQQGYYFSRKVKWISQKDFDNDENWEK